ncbi:MAG: hypothetical protein AAF748_07370 [Pseudomonadota bacterium]
MTALYQPLHFAARHGRWALVLGILAGLLLTELTHTLRPYVPHMIGTLLFLAALRIGPRATLAGLAKPAEVLGVTALLQFAAPALAIIVLALFGLAATPAGLAMVLVLAAPPVTGSPNFTILIGQDPRAAMRLLMVSTAVFPLAAMLIFAATPALTGFAVVLISALKLLAVIAGSVGAAFAIRSLPAAQTLSQDQERALDGLAAILLAILVIGLMSAVGPALRERPGQLAMWLAFACALNFGAQIIAARVLRGRIPDSDVPAVSIAAGNRNVALYLVALPADLADTLLLFIGCYQVPMYLTPLLMGRPLAALSRRHPA